ncbi:hypothetical protein [Sphaerisporangium sp. NPDC051011]|uniref:hypothetical protein n=1 Tax=Sphaerisporangium sp. NPDC051011 TaxID=3155792 RepID=UPI0033FC76F4
MRLAQEAVTTGMPSSSENAGSSTPDDGRRRHRVEHPPATAHRPRTGYRRLVGEAQMYAPAAEKTLEYSSPEPFSIEALSQLQLASKE